MEVFDGRVTLGICFFLVDWMVELGFEEAEADREGTGSDKGSADEVEEDLVEME